MNTSRAVKGNAADATILSIQLATDAQTFKNPARQKWGEAQNNRRDSPRDANQRNVPALMSDERSRDKVKSDILGDGDPISLPTASWAFNSSSRIGETSEAHEIFTFTFVPTVELTSSSVIVLAKIICFGITVTIEYCAINFLFI